MTANKSDEYVVELSEKLIAKNTLYNLLGYGIPLIFAIVLIPPLVNGLGDERFGILNLAWIVVGYFSFFDFGIGKGLTKVIAEKIGSAQSAQIPVLFWTSLSIMFSVSFLASIVLTIFIPHLVTKIFNISQGMQNESIKIFYALAIAVPIVATTAGLKGVLEAYQKFGIINVIRVSLGILTFLVPIIFLAITNSLFWIVVSLIFIRIIVWTLYLIQCFKINRNIKNEININFNSVVPVLKFSIWITLANIIGPIILYSDRFLIGVLVSAAAITFYATPYEIVTKLLLIPGALVGVLFPVFSASFINNPDISKGLFLRGAKFIFLIIYPSVFLIVTFSYQGLELWLGEKFAVSSSLILQFLAIGIFMNSISMIPNNFFQGTGKPKIPTLINLFELPVYILIMWISIKNYGIKGAAAAYLIMATLDALVMYIAAKKTFMIKFGSNIIAIYFFSMVAAFIVPFLLNDLVPKIIFSFVYIISFLIITWKYFLSNDEKFFLLSKVKRPLNNA
jgi:O-antigen/teichoic acid export membrane protein